MLDVSYQLLLIIGYLDHRAIFDMNLIPVFGQGMANWLEIDNDKRRQIALVGKSEASVLWTCATTCLLTLRLSKLVQTTS
jgi:hypothetical protein